MNQKVKIVYEDDNKTKVIRGLILSEDEFTYKLEAENTKQIFTIGKRAIVMINWEVN